MWRRENVSERGGHVNTSKVLVVKGDHAALLSKNNNSRAAGCVESMARRKGIYITDVLTKEKLREMYP